MRAELSAKQNVRVGGRDKKVSKREIATTLFVNGALEKRDHKQLASVMIEARRLFPEAVVEAGVQEAYDPVADFKIVQHLLSGRFTLGEPDPDSVDPLADFARGEPDLGRGSTDEDAWNEGDWDAADKEASDGDQ